jgi:Ca-activated chloride channel family protein
MFRFAHPYFFFLLIPLMVAAWCVYRRRIRTGLLFAPADRFVDGNVTWRVRFSMVIPLLVIFGLALAITALARPQTILSQLRRSADVIAIEMVVDLSGSMQALDLSDIDANGRILKERTRLDAVKETFARFVETRPDDLIGLVTFGGYASTRCPLTTDHAALLHVLDGVEIPKPRQGRNGQLLDQEELLTAIGDALATACARVENAEPESRIIVLLSDGESNTGLIQPTAAIKIAKTLGVKVYTIGVGTTGRAPFKVRDIFGRQQIRPVEVTLDEALLKQIALETGGRYFNVRDPKGLDAALDDIGALEKTRIERDIYRHYTERFNQLLMPALLMIALGAGLNMMCVRRIV